MRDGKVLFGVSVFICFFFVFGGWFVGLFGVCVC